MKIKLLTDLVCKICGSEQKNAIGFSQHLRKHGHTSTSYSIEFLLNNIIPTCGCGCGRFCKVSGFEYSKYTTGHNPNCQWQTRLDKDSDEYQEIISKISKSVTKHFQENEIIVTDETKAKLSASRRKWMEDNPNRVAEQIAKMTETKQQQSVDGILSEHHYTKTRPKEEVTDIYNRIGKHSSETKKRKFASGELKQWNDGLTKETNESLARIGRLNSERLKGSISPRRKYPMNLEEWVIVCEECESCVSYKNRGGYANAIRKIESGKIFKCRSCSNSGREVSEETRLKQSNSAKNKNIDPEVVLSRNKKISEFHKSRWENFTEDERKELFEKQRAGIDSMPFEKKKDWYRKVSEKQIARIVDQYGIINVFKPGYNKDTIPYIVDILNVRYGVEFQHAESSAGEFHIYDKENQRLYYADAYSAELNLWIEFDEPGKFKNGKLPANHIMREERIRQLIPGVQINRIYFDRKIHNNIL